MLNFVKIDRTNPKKRDVLQRIKDYKEVYEVFAEYKASEQASRCMQCGVPYCHSKCPLHNVIPSWLKQTWQKDLELAFALSNETSPFPEILGKICPHDVLCEGECSLNDDYGAISIGAIETYISEKAFKKGIKPSFPKIANSKDSKDSKNSKKVAIIGSGPAGLSAATFLLRQGIGVEMFERSNKAGGLLTYGIPNFKLDKKKVQRRVTWLEEAGLKLHLSSEFGKDIKAKDLLDKFGAIFLAIGASQGAKIGLNGEDATNVYQAIDFLTQIQERNFLLEEDKENKQVKEGIKAKDFDVKDKSVLVVGGGDTAMDCVRSLVREGVKSVKCIYRRDEKSMPGSKKEFENAKEEGVEFCFNLSPKEFILKDGKVCALRVQKTSLVYDKFKKKNILTYKDEYFEFLADMVILALGFSVKKIKVLDELGIKTNDKGNIQINEQFQTSNSRVFAGGDCQRGAHLAVTATADGRDASKEIAKLLKTLD